MIGRIKVLLVSCFVFISVFLVISSPVWINKYKDYKRDRLEYEATLYCKKQVVIYTNQYKFYEGVAFFTCGIYDRNTYMIDDELYTVKVLRGGDDE